MIELLLVYKRILSGVKGEGAFHVPKVILLRLPVLHSRASTPILTVLFHGSTGVFPLKMAIFAGIITLTNN